MKTIQTGTRSVQLQDKAAKTATVAPQYGQVYDAVNKYAPEQLKPVDFDTFSKNPAGYNFRGSGRVLGGQFTLREPLQAMGISIPASTTDMSSWGYQHSADAVVGEPLGYGRNVMGGLNFNRRVPLSTQDNYNSYKSQVDLRNQQARSQGVLSWLQSSNPGIPASDFYTYWSNGRGQTPIRDRMPTYGGVNFVDQYMKGVDVDSFNKAHPDMVNQLHQGQGIGTGFSGQNTLGAQDASVGLTADTGTGTVGGFASGGDPSVSGQSGQGNQQAGLQRQGGFGSAFHGGGRRAGMEGGAQMKGPGYATGGQIGQPANTGPQLGAGEPQGDPNAPTPPGMVDSAVKDLVQRNPQVAQQVRQAVDQAIQSGEITPQECRLIVQMATACLHNPALWPQLKAWAEQQGMAEPGDLPEQFDKGLVNMILVVAKTYDHGGSAQAAMQNGQGGVPQQQYAQGGLLQGPGTGTSDSIQAVNTADGSPVRVSNGEYVIPEVVVKAKGTDFFDQLVAKYQPQQGVQG